MVRIGFWGPLYYNYDKEEPPILSPKPKAVKSQSRRGAPARDRRGGAPPIGDLGRIFAMAVGVGVVVVG